MNGLKKQIEFLDWEYGMFFHFGIRSFYPGHADWDNKDMPPEKFNPTELDCEQWIRVAKEAGATVFAYGSFITAVINFIIMAIVIFLFVKGINNLHKLGKKEEAVVEEAPTTKVCPFCKSEIAIEATRCAHCTSELKE